MVGFVTLWIIACQALVSMAFSRQETWSGLPCPAPGDLPDLGTEPMSLVSPALASRFFTTGATKEVPNSAAFARHLQDGHTGLKMVGGSRLGRNKELESSL